MTDFEKNTQKFREIMGYQYPPTVKKLCHDMTGLPYGTRLEEVVAQSCPFIFDFAYPMFDESHKQILEQKIIKRYFFREISCTDVTEWQFRLDAKMNEIMPYYNKMYESVGLLTDIFDNVDYTREYDENTANVGTENTASTQSIESNTQNTSASSGNRVNSSENESQNEIENNTSNTSSSNRDASKTDFTLNATSDTPQGQLTGLLNNTYLSAAAKVDQNVTESEDTTNVDSGTAHSVQNTSGSNTSTDTITEEKSGQTQGKSDTTGTFDTTSNKTGSRDYIEKVKGKMYGGSKAKTVMEYRKAIMNIDAEIIGRLSGLFMLTYHPYYEAEEEGE